MSDFSDEEYDKLIEYKERIEDLIPTIDTKEYSHNIISMLLGEVCEKFGQYEVVQIIESSETLLNGGWGYIADQYWDEIKKERKIKLLKENIEELQEELKLLELQE
tara:strand:- start:13 stop:330 length:318 start_codon:yes stop_codon:yes gene_type:complete